MELLYFIVGAIFAVIKACTFINLWSYAMDLLKIKKIRNQLIISVVILQIALLIWESLNGGVKTHNLFAREDLFGISNWWGLIILPLLVWITAYSIEHRSNRLTDQLSVSNFYKSVCVNFLVMLLMCLTSSTFFMLGFQNIAIYIFKSSGAMHRNF